MTMLATLLYAFNKYIPYGCFIIFYLLAIFFSLFYLKNLGHINVEKNKRIKFIITNIKDLWSILPFASILFLTQFFMQPLFHYWQPLFEEKFAVGSQDMSIVFIAYSLAMSTISWGYSQVTHLSILRSNLSVIFAAFVGSLVYSFIARWDSFSFSLVFFALSIGIFNLVQIAGGVLIQNRLKQENRMIITKYISFYSRIGMIISLVLLHWLFANEWEINKVYTLYGWLGMIAFCLYFGWMTLQNTEKNYVSESTS